MKIRHIEKKDFEEWQLLFEGYADFYKVDINHHIIKNVWGWLNNDKNELTGLVIET